MARNYRISSYVWTYGTYETLKEAKRVKKMLQSEGKKYLKIEKLNKKTLTQLGFTTKQKKNLRKYSKLLGGR